MRVIQPVSLKDWSRPGTTFHDLDRQSSFGYFWEASPATTLPCQPPILLDRVGEQALFFPQGTQRESYDVPLASLRIDCIPNAQVVGDKCVVVSSDSKVFFESYWSEQNLNDKVMFERPPSTLVGVNGVTVRPTILFRDRPPVRRIDGPAMLLGNPWSFNYHHWMINCLSRLWWREQFPQLRQIPVIVPSPMTRFQEQSLQAIGVAEEQVFAFDGGSWSIERLYFPANGDFWPSQLQWIRDHLFEHFKIAETTKNRLIYISREDASNRRVANEGDVAEFLTKRGFEILQLGRLSLEDQIRAFSQARIVVGPHGSGLTNILFGSPELTLVELHPADEVNHVFWVLANALKQSYAFMSGTITNANRDFTVSLADLDAMLDRVERTANP